MSFLVQDDAGTIEGANANISVAEFKAYHDDRGNDYVGVTDTEIQNAIVLATDYMDSRFDRRFIGAQLALPQRTKWPRRNAVDHEGFDHSSIMPSVLKDATAEYSLRATTSDLAPDPEMDDTNQAVKRKLERVDDVVTEETEYKDGGGQSKFRPYPMADAMIARLLRSAGSGVIRN